MLEEIARFGDFRRSAFQLKLGAGQLGIGALQVGEHIRPGGFVQFPRILFPFLFDIPESPTRHSHVFTPNYLREITEQTEITGSALVSSAWLPNGSLIEAMRSRRARSQLFPFVP